MPSPLSLSECYALFAAMEPDEVGMFLPLAFGADPWSFDITPRSLNRRLHRIARDAKLGRPVTVRNLRSAGRRLGGVELAAIVPVESGAARPSVRASRGLYGVRAT